MSSTQRGAKKPELLEDDDNCSEFSVISVYDDQDDDCDSTHASHVLSSGARIAYRDPSVHESEGFPDNLSSISHHQEPKNNDNTLVTSFPDINSPSSPWNPLTLSGYVSTSSVAELVDKVLNEYTRNHELLTSINSSIMELKKTGRSEKDEAESEHSSNTSQQQELKALQDQLTKANQRIAELEKEKQSNEQQFKAAGKDAEHYILRLESQLSDQCQSNKALREELDERMDELRAARMDLSIESTITMALREENKKNEEEIREQYNNKVRQMEQMFKSYHERSETKRSVTGTQTDLSSTSSTGTSFSRLSSSFAKDGYGLTCPMCHCDCPSPDYYNYHMGTHANLSQCQQCKFNFDTKEDLKKHQTEVHEPEQSDFHTELTTRLANTLQCKAAVPPTTPKTPEQEPQSKTDVVANLITFAEPTTENGCQTPVSEFSASFVLDSPVQSYDVSDVEEALSTGFRTPTKTENNEIVVVDERDVPSSASGWAEEPEEPDMSKIEEVLKERSEQVDKDNMSQISDWSYQVAPDRPDSVADSLSILNAPTDCASSVISESMSSVHSSQIGASASQIAGTVNNGSGRSSENADQRKSDETLRTKYTGQILRFLKENPAQNDVEMDGSGDDTMNSRHLVNALLQHKCSSTSSDSFEKNETAPASPINSKVKSVEVEYLKKFVPSLDQTTLPQRWSSSDKAKFLALSVDCLRVLYTAFEWNDAAMVRADRPIPRDSKFYYFEVTIVDSGNTGYIGVGLCGKEASLQRLPGWDYATFGYHGDDGHFFAATGKGRSYGPGFTIGDVVGCGINFERQSIFFTKNGKNLGVAKIDVDVSKPLYPTVGLESRGAIVEANFGHRKFCFEVEKHLQVVSANSHVPVPACPLPFSQQQPDQCQIFLCDCLCAFPSKGALVTHKAHCTG